METMRSRGLMDKALASGAGDCGFESHRDRSLLFDKAELVGSFYRVRVFFPDVATLAIIHKRNDPNLATGHSVK